jgi:hypothetical protein
MNRQDSLAFSGLVFSVFFFFCPPFILFMDQVQFFPLIVTDKDPSLSLKFTEVYEVD